MEKGWPYFIEVGDGLSGAKPHFMKSGLGIGAADFGARIFCAGCSVFYAGCLFSYFRGLKFLALVA